jgi:hypothetical protein
MTNGLWLFGRTVGYADRPYVLSVASAPFACSLQ